MMMFLGGMLSNKTPKQKRIYVRNISDNDIAEPNHPFSIALNPDKTLNLSSIAHDVTGLYAFCVAKKNENEQYLLLKRMDNYESNHSVLATYLKLKRFNPLVEGASIICGGEIIILNGEFLSWNLKSGAYSHNTAFDEEKSNDFSGAMCALWLPHEHYHPIKSHHGDHYREYFDPKGFILPGKTDALVQYLCQNIVSVARNDLMGDIFEPMNQPTALSQGSRHSFNSFLTLFFSIKSNETLSTSKLTASDSTNSFSDVHLDSSKDLILRSDYF